MTIKEKLMEERPEIDEDYFDLHCPDEEGLIPSRKCKCNFASRYETVTDAPARMCKDCWEQEIGPSVWQIILIVGGVLALFIGLIGFGFHIFAAEPHTDTIDISVVETLEIPSTDEPIEHIEETVVEETVEETIVEETLGETLVETFGGTATDEPVVETEPIETAVIPTVTDIPKGEPVILVATAYCGENYPHICNDGDATTTATGVRPQAGRTIAVDPRMIPYGSKVIINGHTYIAEDCGGAINGNRIDIFFDTHQEALQWGRRTVEAIIITEN